MRYTLLLLALMLSGCACSPRVGSSAKAVERKASVIFVGMLFDEADAKLKKYGAEPTMFQMELTPDAYRRGRELHYFNLRSGAVMDIMSEPGKTGRLVASMSVSTYAPKSWESKIDPERDRFFDSFVRREEYDLEGEPNKMPLPTPASVTPAASAPGAPPPGAAHR